MDRLLKKTIYPFFIRTVSDIENQTLDFLIFFQYLHQSLLDVTTFANSDLHDAIAKTLKVTINIATYRERTSFNTFFSNPIINVFPRDFGN